MLRFHLQRSYSPVVFNQCATLYLVRIFSAARCAGFRQKKSSGRVGRCRIQHGAMPGRVGGKARKKLCASVTSLSRAVFNEREANESRLLYKKEQHGYNSHRIVCIRSRNCAATRLLGGYKMKCGTLAHPPDETIRGWAKVRPFPFVSGVLKRCFSWLDPENQS